MAGDSSTASSSAAPTGTLAAPPPQPTSSTEPGRPPRTASCVTTEPRRLPNSPGGKPYGDSGAAARIAGSIAQAASSSAQRCAARTGEILPVPVPFGGGNG